jgi:glycosyltransferase involved in cell wall biosynthesis
MLFVGDLSRDKGIEILLDAYRGLQNAPALVLIGRRCDHTPERFPKNVHYMGTWPHAAVMAAWQKACLGLVPSLWQEPFGVVAIEAMASGKPVIAANTGGLSDIIIDGETGLLVPPGESRALRKAMERLIADKTLRERMGRAARARAAGYQADQVVAQIEQVYFSLLERNRAEETLV